jgi:hypothetical protein
LLLLFGLRSLVGFLIKRYLLLLSTALHVVGFFEVKAFVRLALHIGGRLATLINGVALFHYVHLDHVASCWGLVVMSCGR